MVTRVWAWSNRPRKLIMRASTTTTMMIRAQRIISRSFRVALVVGIQSVSSLGQFLGAIAILGAAACGALSSFVVKLQYRDKGVPPSTTSLFSLAVGAALTFPVALVTADREVPGAQAVIAVILLGLVCTTLTFMLYYSLIAQVDEERAALGNYLTPIFALLYGVVLLGERITIPAVVGLALIIGGAEITLRGDRAKRTAGKAKAHEYRARPPLY
jgi:drug/metabolite transporter (DMT)-like permease